MPKNVPASEYTTYIREKASFDSRNPPGLFNSLIVESDVARGLPQWVPGPINTEYGIFSFPNGHLEAPPMDFTGDFTIEWFMILDPSKIGEYQDVYTISNDEPDDSDFRSLLNFYTSTDWNDDDIFSEKGTSNVYIHSSAYTTWSHYAVCCSGGDVAIYIDGARASDPDGGFVGEVSPIYIGFYPGDDPFTGVISNFRITIGTALYGDNYIVPTLPLSGGDLLLLAKTPETVAVDSSGKNVQVTTIGSVSWLPGPLSREQPVVSGFSDSD